MKIDRKRNEDLNNLPIGEFRNGNTDVFRQLFVTLFPVICSFAASLLPGTEAPEDIVQDVFIELWDQRLRFSGIDHIKSFLYLTTKNKCLNKIKHENVKNRYAQEQKLFNDESGFFEEQLIKSEVLLHLKTAINKLPPQQRKIMLMNMLGHTNEKIAWTFDISVNTVKLQKKVAYEKLRKGLKKFFVFAIYASLFIVV